MRTRWSRSRWGWTLGATVALLLGAVPAAHATTAAPDASVSSAACAWPMYGHDPARTMATGCPGVPTPATVATLVPRWHVHTPDVVTATPTVVGGVVYVGDWSGNFMAMDQGTGTTRWSTVLGPHRADGQA
ncbi:MAG: PQQ-binding-like beta-propeller repeat protein, partial [Acidimicrobiales bacterium]